jgi:large subunit ribosomal protein L32
MRHTRGHTNNRRSHHALKNLKVVKDKETGNLRLPHRIDEVTGMYRGKQIFSPKAKTKSEKTGKKGGEAVVLKTDRHADHEHAEQKSSSKLKGVMQRFVAGGRPKARSGMGGGA